MPLPVVLALNNCMDRSSEIAKAMAASLPSLALHIVETWFDTSRAHAGSARRLAMEVALERYRAYANLILLTTDADAFPEETWVDANLAAIESGAALVGGELLGDRHEEARLGPGFLNRAAASKRYSHLQDELALRVDPLEWDPAPRHQDHTGASLAVRSEVYRAVGGMRPLAHREDLDFVSRVRAAGGNVRHEPQVRVVVSARTKGRASGGMADCLAKWLREECAGVPLRVEAPDATLARLRLRRTIRCCDVIAGLERQRLARQLGVPERLLRDTAGAPHAAPRLIEIFAPDAPDAASMPIDEATARLLHLLNGKRLVSP